MPTKHDGKLEAFGTDADDRGQNAAHWKRFADNRGILGKAALPKTVSDDCDRGRAGDFVPL